MSKVTATIIGAAVGLILPMQLVFADSGATAGSLSELTAQWRQWAYSIPTGQNPQEDTTGQYCMVGQRGPIWFLAGVFLGGSATRACSIPEGTTLFFPATNQDDFNSPGVCGESSENVPVKDLRAYTKDIIDSVTDLAVQVDGHYANDLIQRVKSIVYATTLPIDNVFNAICGGPGSVPAGVYSPSVDDGLYVMLKPLKVGQHTIHFHAEGGGGLQDVKYTITVVPVSLH